MADYNIFIHSNGTGTSGGSMPSQTTPWANSPQGDQSSMFQAAENVIKKGQDFANNGFGSVINTGVAALSRVFPWVAVAVLAAKITDSVLTTGFTHVENYTGNYEYSLGWNNFKAGIDVIVNPVKTINNYFSRQKQIEKNNRKLDEQRQLVGHSTLTTSVKGV